MKEMDAIRAIMRGRWAKSFCLPRYTPSKWWECDMFERTKAGFFREYEVKLTVADYRADAAKSRDDPSSRRAEEYEYSPGHRTTRWVYDQVKKHDLLAAGDPRGPVEFFYVTPVGLLDREVLPPWAGWIEVGDRGEVDDAGHPRASRDRYYEGQTKVRAPRLHKTKCAEGVISHSVGVCYWRMHRIMSGTDVKDEVMA